MAASQGQLAVTLDQRYGHGVVIEAEIAIPKRSRPERGARLRCDCGVIYETTLSHLITGHTRSCGCLIREVNTKHGLNEHDLYKVWIDLVARCENAHCHNYPNYGGRGIRVCDRWHDVGVFVADIERWLGPRPEGMTLDRICTNHDYRLDNVRWATRQEQNQNRRSTRLTQQLADDIRRRHTEGGVRTH